MSLGLFKHLLPRAKAWSITADKQLREFFQAKADAVSDARSYFEDIWLDLFPTFTRELTAWEQQFGVNRGDLTTAGRREQLTGLWQAQGGQDPRYIQDTLQAAGYDVYVHEWWVPASDPPIARNPGVVFGSQLFGCGDTPMECGETVAECGNSWALLNNSAYALVNKLYDSDGTTLTRREYTIPTDPAEFPFCLYICGPVFGDLAVLTLSQKEAFEDLLLKICPAQQWIIVGVDFQTFLTEGVGGDLLTEGPGGALLTEG